ncbi:MAG: hypothetical protein R2714_06085 [Microthrixaceae bacterium]
MWIKPMWEKACGKFPSMRFASGSYLRQQTHVVAEASGGARRAPGLVGAADEGEGVGQPEGREQEGALVTR